MPDKRILMGVVGRPHGVRGLVHVHSYTADPADLADYSPLEDESGGRWSLVWRGEGIAELRDAGGRKLDSREAAAKLTNRRLYVDRAVLPEPEEEEFYLADLIGLAARRADGTELGRVAVVHDYGAGASLEVQTADGFVILPFTRAVVPVVDIAAGCLTICPPEEIIIPGKEAAEDAA